MRNSLQRIKQHFAFRTLSANAPYSKTPRDANRQMRTSDYFINAQNAAILRARGTDDNASSAVGKCQDRSDATGPAEAGLA
jgi:hypothetical protein